LQVFPGSYCETVIFFTRYCFRKGKIINFGPMVFTELLQPIVILLILMATGYAVFRLKIINEGIRDGLARLVMDVTLPLLILTGIMKLEMSAEILRGSFLMLVSSYVSLFILFSAGVGMARLLHMPGSQARVHALQTMLGNVVFIGYPLMNELFPGGEGLLYASIYHLATNSVLWTFGVWFLSRHSANRLPSRLVRLLNPNSVALVAGFLLMSLNVPLPSLLDASLGGLGRTTLFLSMLFIGALLASYSRPRIFSRRSTWLLTVTKMLVIPLILLILFKPFTSGAAPWLDPTALSVLVMQSAMPCMATFVVVVKRYGADEYLAMDNVMLTTLMSLMILPFLYYLIQLL